MVIIPKEKIKELTPSSIFLSRGSVFALAILGILTLTWGGLFFYKNFLNDKIEEIKNQMLALNEEEKSLENEKREIVTINNQLNNLGGLLDNHFYWSQLFSELEKTTLIQVSFSDFSADVNKNQIAMKGLAPTYGALAQQIASFKKHPDVNNVAVSNISLGGQGISFAIDIKFDKRMLMK